ncbi:MAG TPA: ATP-dependent DNA helicase RecG [Thermoanaerobacterales bacterium]|nr:ATP-dependent DNA helicase RecG [Thermoanaerobacterales bacterium]
MYLSSEIKNIKGVGPARAKLLNRLGIKTIEDVLFFFPRDYLDLTPLKFSQGSEEKIGVFPCIVKDSAVEKRAKSQIRITLVPVFDGKNNGHAVFFNQPYISRSFRRGDRLLLIGKVRRNYGEYEIISPEWQKFDKNNPIVIDKISPIYPLTKGLSQKVLRQVVKNALIEISEIREILPGDIIKRFNLISRKEALNNIHFPESFKMLERARTRLIFEELLLFQLAMAIIRREFIGDKRINTYVNFDIKPFLSTLPFTLTSGQERVIGDIISDLKSEHNMNRLVQGDVGSGKTVVAGIALYLAVKNGLQGAFMAPTEILAEQHFRTLKKFLSYHGIKVDILKGGIPRAERDRILEDLKKGSTDVIVGTHAIIQQDVEFYKLGMVITDEQHRFGVKQRQELIKKGHHPDILVMSATPIPRTLAMVLYSDLDISIIDTVPPGRQKVDTYVAGNDMRKRVYDFMAQEVEKGHQVFVVCPAVEENDLNVSNVEDLGAQLKKEYPALKIGVLHGKMKSDDKDRILKEFLSRKVQVLVATTVVEVGVDVPCATLIIVENAERFGMAQLHQLRGRVGRSQLKSYCILLSDSKDENARARLKYLMKSHDGFEISQMDLEMRGPGEFLGVRQHGFFEFKLANLVRDVKMLESIKQLASEITEKGYLLLPEYKDLAEELNEKIKIL